MPGRHLTDKGLKHFISNKAVARYGQSSKPLQVDTVANLARSRNTFLLAGFDCKGKNLGVVYQRRPPPDIQP
ncbi:hypothetical protein VP01_541g5 [Puccinia sorghi]|uniref:Uncharacterized protein n=1 Tax=Puccinia sorghi TaxID=27349 RepID=A0A0L6ULR9_9BASI|nr:hypothetical protein VP01_541g5 [Puccinia sorghi]